MALTFTVTAHFSLAYSAKAFSAASWMNFETGVISVSSPSTGACAEAPAAVSAATSRTSMNIPSRFINDLLLEYKVRSGRPAPGALDRATPARVAVGARRHVRGRRETTLDRATGRDGVERSPEPTADARQVRGPERRRLDDGRALHRRVEHVGLELTQKVVGRRAAVDLEGAEARLGVCRHRVQHVAALIGDGLERGPREMGPAGAAREADDRTARVLVPVRRAEPDERGD